MRKPVLGRDVSLWGDEVNMVWDYLAQTPGIRIYDEPGEALNALGDHFNFPVTLDANLTKGKGHGPIILNEATGEVFGISTCPALEAAAPAARQALTTSTDESERERATDLLALKREYC